MGTNNTSVIVIISIPVTVLEHSNMTSSSTCMATFIWWYDDVIKWKKNSALLAICAGNSPVTNEFPAQRPVTWSFDVFFDLCLNKPLSKPWWAWSFETPSRPLWRHCDVRISKTPVASACHRLPGSYSRLLSFIDIHISIVISCCFSSFIAIKGISFLWYCWWHLVPNETRFELILVHFTRTWKLSFTYECKANISSIRLLYIIFLSGTTFACRNI